MRSRCDIIHCNRNIKATHVLMNKTKCLSIRCASVVQRASPRETREKKKKCIVYTSVILHITYKSRRQFPLICAIKLFWVMVNGWHDWLSLPRMRAKIRPDLTKMFAFSIFIVYNVCKCIYVAELSAVQRTVYCASLEAAKKKTLTHDDEL